MFKKGFKVVALANENRNTRSFEAVDFRTKEEKDGVLSVGHIWVELVNGQELHFEVTDSDAKVNALLNAIDEQMKAQKECLTISAEFEMTEAKSIDEVLERKNACQTIEDFGDQQF